MTFNRILIENYLINHLIEFNWYDQDLILRSQMAVVSQTYSS